MATSTDPWRRGDKLRAARDRKYEETFAGQKFEILDEVHLPPDKAFQTAFGHRGRHGYIIRNVATGEKLVVGKAVLTVAHERYGAVDLPETPLRRRDRRRDDSRD